MSVVYQKLDDLSEVIFDVPEGESPDAVARKHGLTNFGYCESREEAQRRMAKDRNGKLEPI
jgi:hypothetical protein